MICCHFQVPDALGDRRWMGRRPWGRHHRRNRLCTFLSHCRLRAPQHRRHTSCRCFADSLNTEQNGTLGVSVRVNTPTPGTDSYIPYEAPTPPDGTFLLLTTNSLGSPYLDTETPFHSVIKRFLSKTFSPPFPQLKSVRIRISMSGTTK